MRVAVVDIGTNTTRVLVADVEDGRVHELERRTKVTRLGEGVDATGRLADTAVERVATTLTEYKAVIDELQPERTTALATSAVRDAQNGDEFRQLLHDRFGLDARIIPGDEEARLTFLGATGARPAGDGPFVVIDIGGGSTEYVVGYAGEAPTFSVSTQAGSVRQTERHLHEDPPSDEDLATLRAAREFWGVRVASRLIRWGCARPRCRPRGPGDARSTASVAISSTSASSSRPRSAAPADQ